jgi:hypothetical protein
MLVNGGICFGIFFSNFLGILLPDLDKDSADVIRQDQYWRIVYGFPII